MDALFLVENRRPGITHLVFTHDDPRMDGYSGNVIEGVSLDRDKEVAIWRDGQERPSTCVGRDRNNPKHYKVFKYSRDLPPAEYEPIQGKAVVVESWSDYLKLWAPDELPDEEWYSYLDNLDEASRRRRQRVDSSDNPTSPNRDDVAAWVAKKHRIVDSSIREVWYLPKDAPPDEIRLLEVNDRLAGPETTAEALEIGLDVEGARYRLFVADITTDQLEQIKRDSSRLPPGWSLDGTKVWRRRGMTEYQRLFLVQAQTDFAVFELLEKQKDLHECHKLHYLQMATEMLGKAHAWKQGRPGNTHRAFKGFLKSLASNRKAQKQLGFEGKNANWQHLIRKSLQLAERIEDLAPSLSPNSPNPEYPWPMDEPEVTPVEHRFELWKDLQESLGRQFLKLTRRLFTAADAYL